MQMPMKRIAINVGGGYVPGLNAVITGAVLASSELGWEVVGIRDGFDGLLFSDRYPDGGVLTLTPSVVRDIAGTTGCILGTGARSDPFHVRSLNAENAVEELDRSDELLGILASAGISAVISIVGARALSILWKLSRKGLSTICVPKSAENDIAATSLSFGFNSALSFVAEILDRARQAAQSAQRIAVVEVLGEHAGWLALQGGMAASADAVLIPEVPYVLGGVASRLRTKWDSGQRSGLVVVAEGARPADDASKTGMGAPSAMKAALSPGATDGEGAHVIDRSGRCAEAVGLELQRLTDLQTTTLALGALAMGGTSTVVDRQLGLAYGAGAVQALKDNQNGVMVVFQPPDLKFAPLSEVINKVRTIPADSEFLRIARAIGTSLGDEGGV